VTETATDNGHRLTTLDSGVRVVTERMPGVRSAALGFWIATGSATEAEHQRGISHLLEHMLFRGSERFRSEQIDQIFDAMGAEVNAATDKETTSLYTRVLDRHLERAFDVMSDMIWRPRFEQLDAEREVVLEEIAMYEDDPQDKVFDVLGEAIFGAHPLGRAVIGTPRVVASTTRAQLVDFHAARYVPDRVVIAAAGSVDHDALVDMARAAEPAPRAGAGGALVAEASVPQPQRRVRFLRKDTEQYHVCLGGAGMAQDDERRFALRVLEGVVGATSSSRLFQQVRELRGLAYSIFCFSNLFSRTGEVGLYLGTRPDKLGQAMAVVARELARCVREPADAQELSRSRENLKGRVVLALEATGARMSRLGASVLHGLPILSLDEVIERIDAVDVDQLGLLAGELFVGERLSVAGIGPDSQAFADALRPLGGALVGDGPSAPAGAAAR
jgi:predicted Zn-dependent peptidase